MSTHITIDQNCCTITTDKETATACLFKNPNCFSEVNDDKVTLIYDLENLNTITALINHRKR